VIGALGDGDPREVGRYRTLAELGRGGMGRVLLGAGPDGRLVAVKLVRAQLVEDEDFRERFRREVTASRKVSGAYTAAVVDADADAPTPWLASVFVPGPSLQDAVKAAGPLPEDSVLRLAAGLAAALVDVHGAGLVHRDLKPSNVLLAADGPRVIDFGIARAADSEGGSEITHTGWLIGSPGFMSPEQAESGEVTAASDVFSLGCVLFMACTGKGPFVGPSTPQTLYNVVHAEPDLSGIPDGIRPIVERCLSKDPAGRPTPAQLLEELAGRITPTAQPWPAAVHALIARQHAEISQLLEPQEELTVDVRGDSATLAITKGLLGPWFPRSQQGDDQLTAIVRPPRTPRTDVPVRSVAFASIAVVVSLIVWALWPAPDTSTTSDAGYDTTTTTTTTTYEDEDYDTTTDTETETTETTEDDGPYTATVGDCFADSNSSGSDVDLHLDECVPGNYEVRKRVDGTTDASGACADAGSNWNVAWDNDEPLVLCLRYLYANPVFNASPGECAWADDPEGDWEIVPCDDYEFEVVRVVQGTTTSDDCGDDVRIRFSLTHEETRSDLSVRACMTFRYGNDGAYARTNDCMVWPGENPTFAADCDSATHYVTGYDPDEFNSSFCGSDGWSGWDDDDPAWAEYLNYTVCLRRL
jgi:serine/threonine protein kinase